MWLHTWFVDGMHHGRAPVNGGHETHDTTGVSQEVMPGLQNLNYMNCRAIRRVGKAGVMYLKSVLGSKEAQVEADCRLDAVQKSVAVVITSLLIITTNGCTIKKVWHQTTSAEQSDQRRHFVTLEGSHLQNPQSLELAVWTRYFTY